MFTTAFIFNKKNILEDKNHYTIKKIMLFWGWIYVYMYKEI